MYFDFFARRQPPRDIEQDLLFIGAHQVVLHLVRNVRARRYVLRIRQDGTVRVTIPRGGSSAFALNFARQHSAWIEEQLKKRRAEAALAAPWIGGTAILLRGERVTLHIEERNGVKIAALGEYSLPVDADSVDLRPVLESFLRNLAEKELIPRAWQLATFHQLRVARVVVRNQRSRWGSCSVKRTISLNWRLIHAPCWVRDYLLVHELMHLREMNHSPRFWRLVEEADPQYRLAERWLDEHSYLLHREPKS